MAVTIRASGVKQLTAGEITDFVIDLAERVEKTAKQLAPRETGELRRSINRMPISIRGLHVRVKVATNCGYGLFPEEGTGIYGPTGSVITPKRARLLVFKPRGLSHVISVKSVRGQPGQHFMRQALTSVVGSL